MRIRYVVLFVVTLLFAGVRNGPACDYEMTSNYPGGAYVCVDPAFFYPQGRPHASGSGIAFRFNHAIRGAMAITYAGWSTPNPPSDWLRATAYYSDGATETVSCDNSAWESKQDEGGNWYYCYYMTNWFSAPQGCLVTQVVMISMNDNPDANVVGRFLIDTDGDKLRDTQEQILGTDPNVWDTDGDGLSDGEEVRTATDPLNARSFFAITAITNARPGSVDFTFAWPSTNNKSYRLERFFDPVSLARSTVQDGIPGVFPTNALNVSASPAWTSCFFRVVQTNDNVIGRNAVGYVKITVRSNSLFAARNDFDGLTSTLAISNAIRDQLPLNSQILLWNKTAQTWKSPITKTVFGWGSQGSNILSRGDAFFIRLPASVPSNSYQVFFMGEVPDRNTSVGTGTMFNLLPGLNLNADAYPVSRKWTSTVMSASVPIGSQILTWNETNQSYDSAVVKSVFGWGARGNALTLGPGVGYWIRTTGTVTFSETKPYTWP